MRIVLDLRKMSGNFSYKGKTRIRFKIGQHLILLTENSSLNEGCFPFLEKYTLKTTKDIEQSYVQITVLAQNGSVLAQITVFFIKFKQFQKIEIKNQNQLYKIYYNLNEVAEEDEELPGSHLNLLTKTSVQEEPASLKQQLGKLEILRLGVLMFNFAQRLDPLIYVLNGIIRLITWKKPLYTFGLGLLLTLVIYNLKISILVGGLLLYFLKDTLFRKIERIHKYRNIHKRLMVPEQNVCFLQYSMQKYCQFYQNIGNVLFNDDKTMLISLIQLICKMGVVLVILLLIFGVQHLIVLNLWIALLLVSPARNNLISYAAPILSFLMGEYGRIVDRISTGIYKALGASNKAKIRILERQFYFYHYERWWVLKGWLNQAKKFSDQDYECIVVPKQKAPEGWAWTEEWKIDLVNSADSNGFQYSNDLMSQFSDKAGLATRRRRRWKRTCVKLRSRI